MEALDLSFIDYADGPNLVIAIDRLAYELNFDFEDLRKTLGFPGPPSQDGAQLQEHQERVAGRRFGSI